MTTLPFSVDSTLLQELGKRLVGEPHVALAELIKDSYDGYANQVTIEFLPDQDRIEVRDDGHGMDLDEFKNYGLLPHDEDEDAGIVKPGTKRGKGRK